MKIPRQRSTLGQKIIVWLQTYGAHPYVFVHDESWTHEELRAYLDRYVKGRPRFGPP